VKLLYVLLLLFADVHEVIHVVLSAIMTLMLRLMWTERLKHIEICAVAMYTVGLWLSVESEEVTCMSHRLQRLFDVADDCCKYFLLVVKNARRYSCSML